MALLSLENVDAGYGTTTILSGIDLSVDRGEIVGVIGRNGVGKTTLLKTVVGQLEPTNGTITYDGTDVTEQSGMARARSGIGYIPQGREIFPDLTVRENLMMGEQINEDRETLLYEEVYDYFPVLEKRSSQKGGTLSGGQQQMLAIARALVADPDLLLLDEPSEGIQPSITEQIAADIQSINEELDTTVLFVEQNLNVIQEMSDRCYAIDRGQIVDELPAAQLGEEDLAQYLAI